MGIEPAQAEQNVALKPIISHIPNVYLIHGHHIIITKNLEEHLEPIREVMEVIKSQNLNRNQNKFSFSSNEIKFGEMLFYSGEVKEDPEKVKALQDLQPP